MSNENEIEKLEHDEELKMKKAIAYGWTGSDKVMIAVQSDGTVKTTS